MSSVKSRGRAVLYAVGMLTVIAGQADAHPYHASVAVVDVIKQKDASLCLEVALRVFPDDLEDCLRKNYGDELRLDSPGIDQKIQDYLGKTFRLCAPDGSLIVSSKKKKTTKPTISWVGKEVEVKTAWLYFEVKLSDVPFEIENRILFDFFEDQVNTVVTRRGKQRQTRQYSPRLSKKGKAKQ